MPTPDRPEKQPPFHPFKLDEQNSIPFSSLITITSTDVSCVQHRSHPVFFYFVALKISKRNFVFLFTAACNIQIFLFLIAAKEILESLEEEEEKKSRSERRWWEREREETFSFGILVVSLCEFVWLYMGFPFELLLDLLNFFFHFIFDHVPTV